MTAQSRFFLCWVRHSPSSSTHVSSRSIGVFRAVVSLFVRVDTCAVWLVSSIVMVKALRMSVCVAPRLAVRVNSKRASVSTSKVMPVDGIVRPWVARSLVADSRFFMSVQIPIPIVWSDLCLLKASRSLSVIVFLPVWIGWAIVGVVPLGSLGAFERGIVIFYLIKRSQSTISVILINSWSSV